MTFTQLVAELLRRKVRFPLHIEQGKLRWQAPRGAVTPELKREIQRHRRSLLEWLGPFFLPQKRENEDGEPGKPPS